MSEPVPVSGWLRRLGPQLRPHRRLVATSVGAAHTQQRTDLALRHVLDEAQMEYPSLVLRQ